MVLGYGAKRCFVDVVGVSAALLMLICCGSAARPAEGTLRLVGGRGDYEGTVLIYHIGFWGAICDNGWDHNDAHVVCRQLGFIGEDKVFKRSFFGPGRAWRWMTRVSCYGNEMRLEKCLFAGWGRSNCYGDRHSAGVRCIPPTTLPASTTTVLTTTRTETATTTEKLQTEITDNKNILADEPEVHNMMTPEGSGIPAFPEETDVIDETTEETKTTHGVVGQTGTTIVIGSEAVTEVPVSDDFVAPRRRRKNERKIPVRLTNGRFDEEGRVEVKLPRRAHWSVVCGDTWGILEGMVVCKQLGYGFAKITTSTNFYGGDDMDKAYKSVKCTGKEDRLDQCQIQHKINGVACNFSSSIAGVLCTHDLPDLIPNVTILAKSAHLRDHHLYYLQCAMEENCLAASAYALRKTNRWVQSVRRLMRFSSVIHNRGRADFRPFIPKERWDWHECHMHYHSMEVFAHYDITDLHGNKVAEGHKASFCLEDSQCDPGKEKKFQCKGFADQGISVNCSDNYMAEIDCQWIDITDLSPGNYIFQVLVNPELRVAEMNFDNNLVTCDMFYSLYQFKVDNCTLGPEPLSLR